MGGALKNVLAIACGISDGLEFGNSARAALITRGETWQPALFHPGHLWILSRRCSSSPGGRPARTCLLPPTRVSSWLQAHDDYVAF